MTPTPAQRRALALGIVALVAAFATACGDDAKPRVCGDGILVSGEACDDGNLDDTDGCTSTCEIAVCGDGLVQAGVEACDDGNLDDRDGCTTACVEARCGDGLLHVGVEACDDGNASSADACTNTCELAVCGDGIVRVGIEACDDGNQDDGDGCTSTCALPTCGDGIVDPGEACDDGNADNSDACTTRCLEARCGDGIRQNDEACDDGNADDSDACLSTCEGATCGDGVVRAGVEACDDGNDADDDGCTATCALATCGDGIVQDGEACDDGDADDANACTTRCLEARCGDGFVQGDEACDDGNADDSDACLSTCEVATCGDGVVQRGIEACDDGNDADDDDCTTTCALATCGDGIVQSGEACDDGNGSDRDDCTSRCLEARCGDGFVQGDETCDDGNADPNDDCLNDCTPAACGDGVVWLGVEACDDGNDVDDDACSNRCVPARCGDGAVQPPEICDDGNDRDDDACLTSCVPARCGDGVVRRGVEVCDDGNTVGGDGCAGDCGTTARCGDGVVDAPVEACDDGNLDEGDACSNRCVEATCGDGVVWRGVEACDDGNASSADGCLPDCTVATCGDGIVWRGVEGCDDGNGIDTDTCRNDCTPTFCGDGIVNALEACDDANLNNLDGCLVDCRVWEPCANTRVDGVSPANACVTALPEEIVLAGDGLLVIDGAPPLVTFDGELVAVEMEECDAVLGVFAAVESCRAIRILLPEGLSVGTYPVTVTNGVPEMCGGEASFGVGAPPIIASIEPARVCEADQVFDVLGTGFIETSEVFADDVAASSVELIGPGRLRVRFEDLEPGTYDVTVSNGDSCEDTLEDALEILPTPRLFFVDPEVLYNAISIQATAYVANINGGAVTTVGIRPAGTDEEPVEVPHIYDPARPGEVQVRIPSGLEPGDYEIILVDGDGCTAISATTFRATDRVVVAIEAVEPPFAYNGVDTSITVIATEPLPDGARGFDNGVRLYASPVDGETATALSAVGWVDPFEVTAVVDAGLSPGLYDLIAANPDGTIGVLEDSFRVLPVPVPLIDSVTPGSIPTSSPQELDIEGTGFHPASTVRLFCRASDGSLPEVETTVTSATPERIEATVPPVLSDGTICVVRVTNPDEAYGEFSAIGVTTPAENIPDFELEGESMSVARRYPAVAVGTITRTSRRIYAMGGDTGAAADALDVVEVANLDRFGEIISWRTEPDPLPAPRTLARAVESGGYIYVVGGSMDGVATTSVLRARVLSAADTPEFDRVSLAEGDEGVDPGVWFYRVTAVRSGSDPRNPGGETLASEPQPIRIPDGLERPLEVTLFWTPVPGAGAYRVYRTATPGEPTGDEVLLAEVPGDMEMFTDDGTIDPGTEQPPQLGDLGEWAEIDALNTPRAAAGLTFAVDPLDRTVAYLYVLGGHDDTGTAQSSYEWLSVDATGRPGIGLPGSGWVEEATGVTARHVTIAHAVDRLVTTRVPDDAVSVYWGSGITSGGTIVSDYDVARVLPGGGLGPFRGDRAIRPSTYGHAGTGIANQLFAFGGNDPPQDSVRSVQIECGAPDCPDLANWNAAGISLTTPRFMANAVLASGRIFVLGGWDGAAPISAVESTVW